MPGLVVKVLNKTVANGSLYGKKGIFTLSFTSFPRLLFFRSSPCPLPFHYLCLSLLSLLPRLLCPHLSSSLFISLLLLLIFFSHQVKSQE